MLNKKKKKEVNEFQLTEKEMLEKTEECWQDHSISNLCRHRYALVRAVLSAENECIFILPTNTAQLLFCLCFDVQHVRRCSFFLSLSLRPRMCPCDNMSLTVCAIKVLLRQFILGDASYLLEMDRQPLGVLCEFALYFFTGQRRTCR